MINMYKENKQDEEKDLYSDHHHVYSFNVFLNETI